MPFFSIILIHFVLIVVFLLAIILCCWLFTNAIEHLGHKLNLNSNATGCILAVIGTTLPETIVPLVAVGSAYFMRAPLNIGQNIAQGAIIGSPFMLSCFALFILGVVLFVKKKKEAVCNIEDVERNYKYFLILYGIAILALFCPKPVKYLCALFLVISYFVYVFRTISKSKCDSEECNLDTLIFGRIFKCNMFLILFQIIVSLLGLVLFSHLFTREIVFFSNIFHISPFILSLVVTPFATELPECVNSVIWFLEDKDDLGIANILGAIIFQGSILPCLAIFLTPWSANFTILLNVLCVVLSSILFLSFITYTKKLNRIALIVSGLFYFGFFIMLYCLNY